MVQAVMGNLKSMEIPQTFMCLVDVGASYFKDGNIMYIIEKNVRSLNKCLRFFFVDMLSIMIMSRVQIE